MRDGQNGGFFPAAMRTDVRNLASPSDSLSSWLVLDEAGFLISVLVVAEKFPPFDMGSTLTKSRIYNIFNYFCFGLFLKQNIFRPILFRVENIFL